MRCEPCQGSGKKVVPLQPIQVGGAVGAIKWIVCPECAGAGQVSCCEGTERHAGVAGVDAPPLGCTAPAPRQACPHCGRGFADINGAYSHVRAKHGKAAAARFRREHMSAEEHEPSMGEQLVDAIAAAHAGEPVPEHIALMFPDEIAAARRAAANPKEIGQ